MRFVCFYPYSKNVQCFTRKAIIAKASDLCQFGFLIYNNYTSDFVIQNYVFVKMNVAIYDKF